MKNRWDDYVKEILNGQENEWMKYLRDKISEETPYFIHKSTGAFKAIKL